MGPEEPAPDRNPVKFRWNLIPETGHLYVLLYVIVELLELVLVPKAFGSHRQSTTADHWIGLGPWALWLTLVLIGAIAEMLADSDRGAFRVIARFGLQIAWAVLLMIAPFGALTIAYRLSHS